MMTCVGPAVRHDAHFYPTTDMLCIALVIYFINKCLFIIIITSQIKSNQNWMKNSEVEKICL